jgi:hypothetical protein
MKNPLNRRRLRIFEFSIFFCVISTLCRSQSHGVVCSDGFGSFNFKSTTGVTVSVGAAKNGEFAQRDCKAEFTWNQQNLMVEPDAWQVDVDLMDADLGLGAPVVALQVKRSSADPLMEYDIYSLKMPPRKLRTITGGDFFRAADTNLDGRIEIWTADAGTIDNFENLPLSTFDFAPTIVLRFEKSRLVDVSSEFQPQYDRQIAMLRAQLDARDLSDFKASDGKLSTVSALTVDEFHSLRITKVKVLEMVWCYLYSGRDRDAWQALAETWPSADFDRIHESILNTRDRGIRSEIDGVSSELSHPNSKKHILIYDQVAGGQPARPDLPADDWRALVETTSNTDDRKPLIPPADTRPQIILIRRPAPPQGQQGPLNTATIVNLVIDPAGKVWSAQIKGEPDKALIDATAGWKFVPAFKGNHAVAFREDLVVSPEQ